MDDDDNYLPVKDTGIYTEKLLEAINNVPQEYREMSENRLKNINNPTLKLYELKQNMWSELHSASMHNRKMVMKNIYGGVCSTEYFFQKILRSTKKMAWLVHPLTTYENKISAALQMATERYEELISMDITTLKRRKNEDGEWIEFREIDAKKAGVLLSAIKQLEDRKLGSSIQRQVTQTSNERPVDKDVVGDEKIDDRIKEIERQLGSMNSEVIDV